MKAAQKNMGCEMSETRENARALLAAATPRPWRVGNETHDWVVADAPTGHDDESTVRAYGGHLVCESLGAPRCPTGNAAIIAAAPDLIATLCDEGDVLERRTEEAEAQAAAMRLVLERRVVCPVCSGSGCRCMECVVVNGRPQHTCDNQDRCWVCRGAGRDAEMEAALASGAGRTLLDRLASSEASVCELRAELEAADAMAQLHDYEAATLRTEIARLKMHGDDISAARAERHHEGGST